MKKTICLFLSFLLCISLCFCGCSKKGSQGSLTEITLNEVAHSIFYAPMYVAIENGYFEEEGLDIHLVNGLGADKTMTALLSENCDIGFMGSEATIYVYNQGAEDYAVNFAQLTQMAGNFLVARDSETEFQWENLKNKTVIGGRAGDWQRMMI